MTRGPGADDDSERSDRASEVEPHDPADAPYATARRPAAVQVRTHEELVGVVRSVTTRLQSDPALARLFAVNPVLAFREAGVHLSQQMTDHVLRSIALPPASRELRDRVASALHDATGEEPRPADPQWARHLLFDILQLTPRDTTGASPAYLPAIDAQTTARLAALLPPAPGGPRIDESGQLRTALIIDDPVSPNRLDLEAPVPQLPAAAQVPAGVSLEEMWFYKDDSALVRNALVVGIIDRAAIPMASPATFRSVRDGRATHPLAAWVTGVTFPSVRHA